MIDTAQFVEDVEAPPEHAPERWSLPYRQPSGRHIASLFAQSDSLQRRSAVAQTQAAACSAMLEALIERSARLCKPQAAMTAAPGLVSCDVAASPGQPHVTA